MADITMCKGTNCPFKDDCYRYTANENPYSQEWYMFVHYEKETNSCTEYWADERHKILRRAE